LILFDLPEKKIYFILLFYFTTNTNIEKERKMSSTPPPNTFISVRIVSFDYYMTSPKQGLDVCSTNFLGMPSERVKQMNE